MAASHPEWVLGYQDETWWSRLALPAMHAWADEGRPLRLVERVVPKADTDPKALSCYGLLRADTGRMMLRFVSGRPVSQVTEDYLAWVCGRLGAEGKKALLLVWDNAAWHVSKRVRSWVKAHNRKARAEGGVRIVACFLPVKSPWLNPIEPRWRTARRPSSNPSGCSPPTRSEPACATTTAANTWSHSHNYPPETALAAEVTFDALPDATTTGRVARVGVTVDPATGAVRAEIDLPNPKGAVRPGMTGSVTLRLGRGPADARRVPLRALVKVIPAGPGDPDTAVYVYKQGKARLTPVRVGHRDGKEAEVLAGLTGEDLVVADPKGLGGKVEVVVEVEKPAPPK